MITDRKARRRLLEQSSALYLVGCFWHPFGKSHYGTTNENSRIFIVLERSCHGND